MCLNLLLFLTYSCPRHHDIYWCKFPGMGYYRWQINFKREVGCIWNYFMWVLKAIQFGALTHCKDRNFNHIRIMSDNTTAASYINKKGGLKSLKCNKTAKEIWIWCTSRDLHVSATHIPGKDNFEADKNSRKF